MKSISVGRMKEVESAAISSGVPVGKLMERAGYQCALIMRELGCIESKAIVYCGPGNNGGDGLVCARHLSKDNDVRVVMPIPPTTEPAKKNLLRAKEAGISILDDAKLEPANFIVDALLGAGAKGAPRPPIDSAIRLINSSGAKVISIDVPSGMDAGSGNTPGDFVSPDITIAIHATKNGIVKSQNKAGKIIVADIGLGKFDKSG
jgi:NAD(P)H-hydrate epimerase